MRDFELGSVADFFHLREPVFESGEKSIALHLALHERQIKIGTERERLRVNLGAAADKNFPRFGSEVDLAQIRNGAHAGEGELRPAENNRLAIRQRFTDRLKRFAPHHDDVSGGELFEPLKIFRQVPRNSVSGANHTIEGHCRDGFEVFHPG